MQHKLTSQERRAAIISAAVRLFSDKGFRGTTTRELASAVGVSEPVLYQHFATKGELYDAILNELTQAETAEWDAQIAPYLVGSDDRALFRAVGTAIITWHKEDPALMRLLFYSALEGHDLAHRFFDTHVQSFMNLLEEYICRRQREGAFARVDPRIAVRAFTGMMAHYGIHSTLFGKGLDLPIETVVETMVDLFLRGIEASSPCEA